MDGKERILSRIQSDCDESVRKTAEHAKHECDRITAAAQHEAGKQAAAVAEKTAQTLARMQASAQSRAQLEKRNALLKKRREEIDKTVAALETEGFEVTRIAPGQNGKVSAHAANICPAMRRSIPPWHIPVPMIAQAFE